MRASVGIQWRGATARFVRLGGSSGHPRLESSAELTTGDDSTALTALVGEWGLSGRRVTLALSGDIVRTRRVAVPLTSEAMIRSTIAFQAERLVPGVVADDVLVDFVVTGRSADETELLIAVVEKAALRERLDWLREGGLEPAAVTVDFVAELRLLSEAGALGGAERIAVVAAGEQSTRLLIVEDGRLIAERRLPASLSADPAQTIARAVRFTTRTAGREGVDRLVILGRVPEGAGPPLLRDLLGCEIRVFDPAEHVQVPEGGAHEDLVRRSPAAVGAAMARLGRRPGVAIDFLRREKRYRSGYESIRKPALAASVLLVAWIAVALIGAMQARGDAARHLARMHQHARALFDRVVDGKRPKYSSTFHKTLELVARQRSESGGAAQGWDSFLDFLRLLTEHIPCGTETLIQSVSFRGQKAVVRGEAASVAAFEELARGLEACGRFDVRTPFRMRSGRRDSPSRLSFTIELAPRHRP